MHLKRVRVPDFRVLKDIDITFEPDLIPRIFPLGSLNGGGKSTLLQLIFTLLHCCGDPNLAVYIENIFDGFNFDLNLNKQDIATIELLVKDRDIKLAFFWYDIELIGEETESKWYNIDCDCYHVCNIDKGNKTIALACKFSGASRQEFKVYFNNIRQCVFLAAPITQVFIFLDRSDRSLLFKGGAESHKYYSQLDIAKSRLPGFFAYDLLAVNLLIQAFIAARDDDFRVAISNGGKYGNSYEALIEDLNRMLVDKSVNIDSDFKGVSFSKVDSDGKTIQLYPEDLSHGELKRLSLYMWLKFNKIENAIVLIDEVEIALHPDWQYQIVNDLQTWAPNNQYILATHSYELCQALTPAHVKEIEPKLSRNKIC
jgi:hypothetical protein